MNIRISHIAFICLVIVCASSAFAGGPFAVDTVNDTGVALRWTDNTLSWYLDPGNLSSDIDNATGKTWVDEALGKWTAVAIKNADLDDVSTTVLKTEFKGNLGEDVTVDNVNPYVSTSSGQTAVIFDEDGGITAELMGEANKGTVVGLSAPLLSDASGRYITKGFALFNGYILSSGALAQTESIAQSLFQATILHEIGHLINLDHSQVNDSIAQACASGGTIYSRNGSCPEDGQYIPTMYPELFTTLQGNLTRDDKVTLSWIYPNTTFDNDFCTITGEVFDGDGNPLKGVNVIAARAGEGDGMAKQDARSFVSGVLKSGCEGDSAYYLHGIVPGHKYQVTYEPLNSAYTGPSGFEPLDNPPGDFDAGTVSDTSGNTTVQCDQGGETIQMASVTISTTNPCTGSGEDGGGDGGDEGGSSGGCGLVESGDHDGSFLLPALSLMIFVLSLSCRRISSRERPACLPAAGRG